MKKTKKAKKEVLVEKEVSERPTAAFILSLISGILILVSGIMLLTLSAFLSERIGRIMIAKESFITLAGLAAPIAGLKIAMGVIIIIGAGILFKSEATRMSWGIIVVVMSIISLIFSIFPPEPIGLIGAIMGILGGALGLGFRQ